MNHYKIHEKLEDELIDLLGMINEMKVATEIELMANTTKKPGRLKEMVAELEKAELIKKDFAVSASTRSSFGEAYKTTKKAFKFI